MKNQTWIIIGAFGFAAWYLFSRNKSATVSPTALSPAPSAKGSASGGSGGSGTNPLASIVNSLTGQGQGASSGNPLSGLTNLLSGLFSRGSGNQTPANPFKPGANASLNIDLTKLFSRSPAVASPINYPELKDLSALPPGEAASYKDAGATYVNSGMDYNNLFGPDPFVSSGDYNFPSFDPGGELSPSPVTSPTYVESSPAPIDNSPVYDPGNEMSWSTFDPGNELN